MYGSQLLGTQLCLLVSVPRRHNPKERSSRSPYLALERLPHGIGKFQHPHITRGHSSDAPSPSISRDIVISVRCHRRRTIARPDHLLCQPFSPALLHWSKSAYSRWNLRLYGSGGCRNKQATSPRFSSPPLSCYQNEQHRE